MLTQCTLDAVIGVVLLMGMGVGIVMLICTFAVIETVKTAAAPLRKESDL